MPNCVMMKSALLALALVQAILLPGRAIAGDSCVRPFGARAPWNVRVAELPRAADSDRLAELLWQHAPAHPGDFNMNFEKYTYPVYYASDATGDFPIQTKWQSRLDSDSIPWNPAWQPAPGRDGQVIVLDEARGIEWDIFQAEFRDGVIHATNASRALGNYHSWEGGNPPSRGVGIAYLAMLVRPEEVARGVICHALSMPIRNTSGRAFVAPATKLEYSHGRDGIPEGTRFAIAISDAEIADWAQGLPADLRRSGTAIAVALRDYGWFITDTSGSATLQFEARVSAGERWDMLGFSDRLVGRKSYPRDLVDGLLLPERIYALVPSDAYPEHLRARD